MNRIVFETTNQKFIAIVNIPNLVFVFIIFAQHTLD